VFRSHPRPHQQSLEEDLPILLARRLTTLLGSLYRPAVAVRVDLALSRGQAGSKSNICRPLFSLDHTSLEATSNTTRGFAATSSRDLLIQAHRPLSVDNYNGE
jgi:hypothetical protein